MVSVMRGDGSPLRNLAQVHKALGDETRLRILNLLGAHGELCGCDVESILAITQSKASRHLNYLKQAAIIEDRRDGNWVYYRITKPIRATLRAILRDMAEQLRADEQIRADLKRVAAYQRSASCAPVSDVTAQSRRRSRS